MNDALIVDISNHRSRARIRNMGEVFTPEAYVLQLLDQFDRKVWSDDDVVFFEPTCGHGNIVLPLVERRIAFLGIKYEKARLANSDLCAIATAINSLWAIDISPENVELTRKRVFGLAVHRFSASRKPTQPKIRDFLAHLLCTLIWQIHENEALSAISHQSKPGHIAAKTKLGNQWQKRNGIRPINFRNDWCSHFLASEKQKVIPAEFLRALRYIDSVIMKPTVRGFEEFSFATDTLRMFVESSHISGNRSA